MRVQLISLSICHKAEGPKAEGPKHKTSWDYHGSISQLTYTEYLLEMLQIGLIRIVRWICEINF
jgi:hypothetical protein